MFCNFGSQWWKPEKSFWTFQYELYKTVKIITLKIKNFNFTIKKITILEYAICAKRVCYSLSSSGNPSNFLPLWKCSIFVLLNTVTAGHTRRWIIGMRLVQPKNVTTFNLQLNMAIVWTKWLLILSFSFAKLFEFPSLCIISWVLVHLHTCTHIFRDFPSGSEVMNPPANTGDMGSVPGSGRSPGGEHGNPLQCSCLVGFSPWGHKQLDTT